MINLWLLLMSRLDQLWWLCYGLDWLGFHSAKYWYYESNTLEEINVQIFGFMMTENICKMEISMNWERFWDQWHSFSRKKYQESWSEQVANTKLREKNDNRRGILEKKASEKLNERKGKQGTERD